jgi:predicted ArsR family transcriptional regulator
VDRYQQVAALADPLRRRLYDFVAARSDAVSREEAAEGAEVPLHTARFHLERLVEEGLLETEFRRLTGRTGPGAGRPSKLYRRASVEVSVSLPPRSYDLVGSVLAGAVARSLAGEPLDEALNAEARRRGEEAGSSYDGPGDDVERTAGLLDREGFEPDVDDGGAITLRNCPFDALAQEQPAVVCGVNLAYLCGALDGLGCAGLDARLDPAPDRCCVAIGCRSAQSR